ncbi:hypothetical protein [Marivirga arenosa]|uniref:Uncharacterized protein n=1 Tax=Marivirga arenosa TaxID=3059076 RepID=A0AA49GGV9_9BACT|nr:hypothetical protein [Marivirga sp. BKB1-2]WKK81394.1 hypothetical protein QYS47_03445 [Marivirga sp. BKB1-2]
MSKENFEALKDKIERLSPAEIKTPNMPVDVFLQEAYNLYQWSKADQGKLIKIGIKDFQEFEARIGALSYVQSQWVNNRYQKGPNRQEWDERSKKAEELKNELENAFRFAFRKRADLLKNLQKIVKGSHNSDLIQDLSDLSILGKANLPLLEAISFEGSKLDQAENEASELSSLLAKVKRERKEKAELKVCRDKTYSYLKELVDEVSQAGKYLFRNTEAKRKGYFSRYLNKR